MRTSRIVCQARAVRLSTIGAPWAAHRAAAGRLAAYHTDARDPGALPADDDPYAIGFHRESGLPGFLNRGWRRSVKP